MTDDLAVVPKLLVDLKIESLIIIDDEWETTSRPAVEDVIGEVRGALLGEDSPERQRISAVFDELDLKETGPWDEQLRRRWTDGDEAVQERLAAQLVGRRSDSPGPLAAALPTIASWFGENGPRLVQLTPRQWDTDGKRLLDDVKGSAICLFDEELHTGRKGTSLMEAALAEKRPEGRFFFGLLTATIPSSSEEAKTESLQGQLSSDRVIVIAKDRTTDGAQFADRLRNVVLATYHDSLRTMAKDAITNAQEETTRRLDSLTVTDFDRIVLETAHREGTWEGDELLRLIGIWERSERRTRIFAERDQIEQLLHRIRAARPATDNVEPASSRVRELRRLELYATDDINRAYLPIELGDVFSLDGEEWVLLVQACEMMVRKNGQRARDPRFAPLAAITQPGVPPDISSGAYYRLEYYAASTGNEAYVDFRKVALLPLSVLDLVSFRFDGQASIDPTIEAPAGAFASLRKRYGVLAKEFKTVLKDLEVAEKPPAGNLPKDERSRLERLALAPYQGEAGLKLIPIRTTTELSFGLHRSGRILPPHATAMLTRFHQWRSRPAFEADFAREYS
jgi:hypothetical protein